MSRKRTSTRAALAFAILFSLATLLPSNLNTAGHAANSIDHPPRLVPTVVINEADSDTPGTDVAEFVELYDGGVGNTPLDGYVVVFFNGAALNDASYAAFDLDGSATNANGYFTLGNSAVPGVDLIFSNGGLQNGPDAIALFAASASDFPNNTPITTTNIRDALVYNNGATIDAGLLVLLNAGQTQINENSGGTGTTVSMQRMPNGAGGERNTTTYQVLAPTPDSPNIGPTMATVSLSGRVTDAFGTGIRGSRIMLEGGGLSEPRMALSSSLGYYNFEGLLPGTYMVTINSKRHTFALPTRVVAIISNIGDFDFVAEPLE